MEHELAGQLPTSIEVHVEYDHVGHSCVRTKVDVAVMSICAMSELKPGEDVGIVFIASGPMTVIRGYRKLHKAWKQYLMLRTLALFN